MVQTGFSKRKNVQDIWTWGGIHLGQYKYFCSRVTSPTCPVTHQRMTRKGKPTQRKQVWPLRAAQSSGPPPRPPWELAWRPRKVKESCLGSLSLLAILESLMQVFRIVNFANFHGSVNLKSSRFSCGLNKQLNFPEWLTGSQCFIC